MQGNSSLPGSVFNHSSPFYKDIYAGNPALDDSQFASYGYFRNNFNDIASSFVLLFELMVVCQWHILGQGYVLLTNKASHLYFLSFHLLTVIIILKYASIAAAAAK